MLKMHVRAGQVARLVWYIETGIGLGKDRTVGADYIVDDWPDCKYFEEALGA